MIHHFIKRFTKIGNFIVSRSISPYVHITITNFFYNGNQSMDRSGEINSQENTGNDGKSR